jgi:hypothetical protein
MGKTVMWLGVATAASKHHTAKKNTISQDQAGTKGAPLVLLVWSYRWRNLIPM